MAINIKPSHKGLFTKKAKAAGEGVQEFARHVLAAGSKASAATKKQANFARNAKHFKHGGKLRKSSTRNTILER